LGDAASLEELFSSFVCEWTRASPVLALDQVHKEPGFDLELGVPAQEAVRMMYCDAVGYLPGDILCKVDRAAMANSLETRVPFLDHRVAEVGARIPLSMKVNGNRGKMILRRLLYRDAPASLFERPKAGFLVPVGEWMKGALRPWVEALLDEKRLKEEGFFDPGAIRSKWDAHLRAGTDPKAELWPVLMFQAWLEEQRPQVERELRYA
jgi:asparagine synthase (glutamine-hydrolysing)